MVLPPRTMGSRVVRVSAAMAALCLAACSDPTGSTAAAARIELSALDGSSCMPRQVAPGQVNVVVFTSHECPIANAYAPTLGELARAWAEQPVRLYLVHVAPDLEVAAAESHRRDFALPGTVLLDPAQRLAEALGVTRTPEAVVLAEAGLVYRGRIDDQWRGLGVRRPAASVHDLRDAVAAALRGEVVPPPHPAAVGCLLPEPQR